MKKIILLFFILAGTIHLSGQEYVPLIDSTRIWNVAVYGGHGGGAENWEYYFGDTISIEDTLYIEVFAKIDWWVELKGYMREDIVSRKIYYRSIFDDESTLLYDFFLEEGETVKLYGNHGVNYTVLKTDSIEMFNGEFRKRWVFSGQFDYDNVIWIEGIGNTTIDLLNPGDLDGSTLRTIILCCYENEELVYMNEEFNTCQLDWVSVDEAIEPIVKVYPNPFNQKLSISFENPVFGEKHEIMIKALDGRVVYKETLNSDISLDLSFLSKGIYLLVLTNRDFQYTKKIIKL
jgi:hypothetical protein